MKHAFVKQKTVINANFSRIFIDQTDDHLADVGAYWKIKRALFWGIHFKFDNLTIRINQTVGW